MDSVISEILNTVLYTTRSETAVLAECYIQLVLNMSSIKAICLLIMEIGLSSHIADKAQR